MYGIITIAGVNCDEDEEICDEFEAYGYPKIYAAPANIDKEYIRYDGEMKVSKIASFAVKFMQNFVQIVTEENYERFITEKPNKIKVLFFTHKQKTTPLLRGLSKEYLNTLTFGEIRQTETKLYFKFNVQ
jgi:hypothetical protein